MSETAQERVRSRREPDNSAFVPLPVGVPYTHVHRRLRQSLETAQDLIVVVLCVLLLALMLSMLWRLIEMAALERALPAAILSQVVLVLILTELYRSLIFYLREHRIAVSLMVEVAIVSLLRELILQGLESFTLPRVAGISLLLLVLGALLAVDRWINRPDENCPPSSAQ